MELAGLCRVDIYGAIFWPSAESNFYMLKQCTVWFSATALSVTGSLNMDAVLNKTIA